MHQHTQVANTIPAGQGHAVASDQLDAADEPVDYHAFKSGENQNEDTAVSTDANKESEPYKS